MAKNATPTLYILLSCVLTLSQMFPIMLRPRKVCNLFKVMVGVHIHLHVDAALVSASLPNVAAIFLTKLHFLWIKSAKSKVKVEITTPMILLLFF